MALTEIVLFGEPITSLISTKKTESFCEAKFLLDKKYMLGPYNWLPPLTGHKLRKGLLLNLILL